MISANIPESTRMDLENMLVSIDDDWWNIGTAELQGVADDQVAIDTVEAKS